MVDNGTMVDMYRNLEGKLDQEKLARQRAETQAQEKARELSMLTVDNRQLQYRLDKIQADFRQEADKVNILLTCPLNEVGQICLGYFGFFQITIFESS
jgi:hypothetical protein